jgi:tRNA modification GTPase
MAGSSVAAPGEILDRVNYVFLPGPGTATGEDLLEIYPHGNPLLVDRILEALLALPGIRLAGPGEFTRRALENGKIDLLQAEAVGELIHAETLDALRNAQRIASGELAAPLRALRDALVDLSVRMELDVDFAEEEADPDYPSWLAKVEGVREGLARLSRGFERGRLLARTPKVVLLGAPNAGKSSLVNALVEEDRLLVSAIPGTTRDYVEVPLRLPGGMVHLVDTAGLGRPVDALDEAAMERTRAQGARADLVIRVVDGTGPQVEPDDLPAAPGETILQVRTKKDLPGFLPAKGTSAISSRTREGIPELLDRLDEALFRSRTGGEEDVRLATARQFQAVEAARERVEAAYALLKGKPAIEILAFEIREAAKHLRDLLGEISADEVLQRVFAGFCIGK